MRKNKSSFYFSLKSLGIGCSALAFLMVSPSLGQNPAMGQDVAALNPTSGWNLKSDADKTNGYCALSRSFDDNVILTLGRNQAEEYSLAIDFQKAKLDEDKPYSITLQPAAGQIRAYEMMPASARAIVVRLGYDDSFFKALEKSNLLKAEINKVKYNFQMNDMGEGNAQLDTCLAKIKGNNGIKTAQNFKAEKIDEAEKTILANNQKNAVAVPAVTPKIDSVKIIPKPVEIKQAPKPIEIKKAAVEVKPAKAKPPKEITIERVGQKEIALVKTPESIVEKAQAVQQNEKSVKTAIASSEASTQKTVAKTESPKTAAVPAQVDVQNIAPAVTQKQTTVAAQPKGQRPTEIARNSRLSSNESVSLSSLNANNSKPLTIAAPTKSTPIIKDKKIADTPAAPQEAKRDIKTAQINKLPKVNYEAPITNDMLSAPKPFSSGAPKLEKIAVADTAENENQVNQKKAVIEAEAKVINEKQQKLAKAVEAQEKKLEQLDKKDSKNEVVINNIREEIAILRIENRKLIEDAQNARAQLDSVAVESGNQAMKRIREYERKLEAAQADNLTLARQMEEMQSLKAQGRLDAVNGDINLTQTTSRYNEAEREIKRLGLLLEQQRAAHSSERRELEQMLFDPAVTNEQQRKRLSELENKLKESEAQYARAQNELAKRAAIKPEVIVKPDPKTEAERQRLSNEKLKLEQQLTASQQKYAQELKAAQQQLQQSQIALQQKPKTEIVIKADPKVEAEKKILAAEKAQLQNELQAVQSQLSQTQIALKKQEERKPPVAMADPLVQRNNIQIEQLNKKLSLQNQQLQTYQRKIELEQQEQETLKQEQVRLREEQELLKQQAILASKKAEQAEKQAKIAQQSMAQAKQDAQIQAQKLLEEQQRIQSTLQQERAKVQQEQEKLALLEKEKLKVQAQKQAAIRAQQEQAAATAKIQAQKRNFNVQKIETILSQSGLFPNNGVRQTTPNEFRWNIGNINGIAKVVENSQTPNMNSFVQGYIASAKQSCNGDFASLPSQTGQPNNYEIACVGGAQNTSSSILFTQRDNHYIAIIHETTANDMDMAMDARDRIAEKL